VAKSERGGIDDAVAILGRKKRIIENKAAMGEIPGAVKVWGRWTFDLEKLRAMVRDREKQQCAENIRRHQAAAIGVAIPSTRALGSKAGLSDGRFTQVTRKLRRSAVRRESNA
jgi:hypothetical protein